MKNNNYNIKKHGKSIIHTTMYVYVLKLKRYSIVCLFVSYFVYYIVCVGFDLVIFLTDEQ